MTWVLVVILVAASPCPGLGCVPVGSATRHGQISPTLAANDQSLQRPVDRGLRPVRAGVEAPRPIPLPKVAVDDRRLGSFGPFVEGFEALGPAGRPVAVT